jgi:hypothetical protein
MDGTAVLGVFTAKNEVAPNAVAEAFLITPALFVYEFNRDSVNLRHP